MQFSRSLFAVLVLGSLVSIPAKAIDDNVKLAGAGLAFASVLYFTAVHKVDTTKTDAFSKVLNAAGTAAQSTYNLVSNNLGKVIFASVFAAAAYHGTRTHEIGAIHTLENYVRHHHVHIPKP